MIRGVGIDLVEIERVRAAVGRWGGRFLDRVFAPEEVADARRGGEFAASLAARFAAKEAAYKAVRDGFGEPLALRSIRVSAGRGRAPEIRLAGAIPREAAGLTWWCSLAHTEGFACAVVIAEAAGGPSTPSDRSAGGVES